MIHAETMATPTTRGDAPGAGASGSTAGRIVPLTAISSESEAMSVEEYSYLLDEIVRDGIIRDRMEKMNKAS